MSKYYAKSIKGKLSLLTDRNREGFKKDLVENDGARYTIERITPESIIQRGFYHGAVLRLWAYLNEYNYKSHEIIDFLHEEAKREFNGELIVRDGKKRRIGKSTKGKLNKGFIDKVIDYLEEEYAIKREEVLNPEDYKYWKNEIFPQGQGPDDFIDYLLETGKLHRPEVVDKNIS